MLGQAEMDRERLNVILKRHNLHLPRL
jgi:hypothetical protein